MTARDPARTTAQAEGLKHYFNGNPCKRGHVVLRFVSTNGCVECHRDYVARPESVKLGQKNYYYRNREKRIANTLAWQKTDAGRAWIRVENRRRKKHIARATTAYGQEGVEYLYAMAADLGLTVDHLVPLRHPKVSGLHNIFNLVLLSGRRNSSKGNTFQGERVQGRKANNIK